MSESAILSFYRQEGPDAEGRMLEEIREADDEFLEDVHNFIQWLFPTRQRSSANPRAPVLDEATIQEFRRDDMLQQEVRVSLDRMLEFYGLEWTDDGNQIVPSARWQERSRNWLRAGNHNLVRITRILDCLRTLGLQEVAQKFLDALSAIYATPAGRAAIGDESFRYWSFAGGQP